jgi:hypothetical protein
MTLHEVCELYVVCRSYAHEREFFVENASLSSCLCTLDYMSLCILLAMLVLKLWLSCLSMSQF